MAQSKKSVSQTAKTTVDTEEVATVEIDFDGGSPKTHQSDKNVLIPFAEFLDDFFFKR